MSKITDDFLYIHMPKTGGTWIDRVMQVTLQARQTGRGHWPLKDFPPEMVEERFILGTVRDPWSWYASWWQHGMNEKADRENLEVYGQGSTEFRDVLWGATHAGQLPQLPTQMGVLWSLYPHHPTRFRRQPLFADSGLGAWSWIVYEMYGDTEEKRFDVDALIDMQQLKEGAAKVLQVEIGPRFEEHKNTRLQRPDTAVANPRDLYDEEMVQWVWDADGELVRRLGYTGPFEPATAAVILP